MSPKSSIVRTMALLSLMAPAISSAQYAPDASCPWTLSASGTASGASVAVDREGYVLLAGNIVGANRDVMLLVYSNTDFGFLLGGYLYDPAGDDDGVPAVYADWHPLTSYLPHNDIWIAFTCIRGVQGGNMYYRMLGGAESRGPFEFNSGFSETLAGLSVISRSDPNMQDPAGVGTVNIAGQDMMQFSRYSLYPGDLYSMISATAWDSSGSAVYGKACVRGEEETTWAIGQGATKILLQKYTSSNWRDSAGDGRPQVVPGFPLWWTGTSPLEVRSAVRDVASNLWLAGKFGGNAAVWKFSRSGVIAPGFPVTWTGTGASSFNGIAIDEDSNVFAMGEDGEDMLLVQISPAGKFLTTTLYDGKDIIAGNAIAIGADRSIWIAATITAPMASTIWAGSMSGLFRYAWSPDPSPAEEEDFVLRAPKGGLLNLARDEAMSIIVNPPRSGDIKVLIMDMRGEVVRDFVVPSGGGRTVSAVWDGRNSAGERVATGVYAIKVSGGGVKGLKRAAVIRRKE